MVLESSCVKPFICCTFHWSSVIYSLVEAFVKYSPRDVFLIEAGDCLCGYVAVHNDGKEFYKKVKSDWLPSVSSSWSQRLSLHSYAHEDSMPFHDAGYAMS